MEYDPKIGLERCLWRDCSWINRDNIDLDKAFDIYMKNNGTQFKKFAKSLKPLTSIWDT